MTGLRKSYLRMLQHLETSNEGSEAERAFAEKLIRKAAASEGIFDFGKHDRIRYARHLLELGEGIALTQQRICLRFDVSRSQAYADIEEALDRGPTVQKTRHFLDKDTIK